MKNNTYKCYSFFEAIISFRNIPVIVVLASILFAGCASTKNIDRPDVEWMEIHYEVSGDSIFIQYSSDAVNWVTDTISTKQRDVLTRKIQKFNRLKVKMNDKIIYSKVIRM